MSCSRTGHTKAVSMSIAKEAEFEETAALDLREGDTAFAVYSYVAETDEAINLVEGERLYILETHNQDWWFVRKHLTEEKGWVPAQYLMDEANYTLYLQKKLNEKIDKLPVFEKPAAEERAIAPIFTEKLRPKHTPDGYTVQFECQVEGYPRPQITWFRQTAIIKPSQDFQMYYDDDNVATLVIREVFPEDAGTFTCVAKNAAGFASSTTELIVEAPLSDHGSDMTILSRKSLSRESSLADILEGIPPTFSKKPKAQYVDEGSQIILECRLVAIPEPEILWLFAGMPIFPDENISIVTESDMHMYCSVLKIANVQKVQEGTYTVLATNREGEASLPIVLKIKTGEREAPQVIEPLTSMTIREGESVMLSAQVVGNPAPSVSWLKDGNPAKSYSSHSDGGTHTITIIDPKNGKDDGVYTLKATNSEGSSETSAIISVEEPTEEHAEPPLFIHRFQEVTVKEKGTIKLAAKVTGNPVPNITWFRNNQVISTNDNISQIFDGENIELIILKADSEVDSGDYKCVASNTAGKASHGAKVTVDVAKVTFIKNLQNCYEVDEGTIVVLECETSHTVSTKWYHNKKELSGMDHREIIQEGRVHKLRIKKTKISDAGAIKCTVKDQETETKLNIREIIPEFIRKLQDCEVKEKELSILEVEITSETADVLWEKDGVQIYPVVGKYEFEKKGYVRKLIIRDTSVHDEGEYVCILGEQSCMAEVTVVELPPEIITKLKNQKVSIDTKVTFEIELTKGDALVKWFKNNVELQFSDHIQLIIDGKKQKLKIYNAQIDDSGEYSCEVGSSKCQAKLQVEKPSIDFTIKLPDEIIVPIYSNATLTVELPNEDIPVTWYRKNKEIYDSEKYTLLSESSVRTLIINNALEEDQSEYKCCMKDAKTSTKLKVEVIGRTPIILQYEKEYRVVNGDEVTFIVKHRSIPQPKDEWFVNGKVVKKSKNMKISLSEEFAKLTIKKVDNTHNGLYTIKLINNAGAAQADISLIVLDTPSKPGKPDPTDVGSDSVNLHWTKPKFDGNSPILEYILKHQQHNTDEWITTNVSRTTHLVQNLKFQSLYKFQVFAVNSIGISEGSEITENVKIDPPKGNEKPIIQKPLKDIITETKKCVTLECVIGGIPLPIIEWFKDDIKLESINTTYESRIATLCINNTTTESEGIYKCVAHNDFDKAYTTCKLTIQEKPVIVINEADINKKLRVGEDYEVTAHINGIPVPNIKWTKDEVTITNSKEYELSGSSEKAKLKITNLKRNHSGEYRIEARNSAGKCSLVLSLRVFDKPSKPEGPVILRELSRESVTIEWKEPVDDGGLELTKYAIEKCESNKENWTKVADVDKDVKTYCIQKLNENSQYIFRIMAQNPIGYSEALESEKIIIKTSTDVPSPPLGPLGIFGVTDNSLTLTWYPPERDGGSKISGYIIEIKQNNNIWEEIATSQVEFVSLSKLKVSSICQFRIFACNDVGSSLPYTSDSEITLGKTLSTPLQPQNFIIAQTTSKSVTLKWEKPYSDGGSPILNYIIEYKYINEKQWIKSATVESIIFEHCVENLREKSELLFKVTAENLIGVGLPAESKIVHLSKHATVPSPPTAPLEIRMFGPNMVIIEWGQPEFDGGAPLEGYNIAIRDVKKTMWMEVGKVDVITQKFNIKDLQEGNEYIIRIYARNEIGLSEALESDEPFKVTPSTDFHFDEEPKSLTEMTEPTSFSTQTTTSWLREHNMDADIRSYARGSLLRRDEYFFRIWYYAKQLFK